MSFFNYSEVPASRVYPRYILIHTCLGAAQDMGFLGVNPRGFLESLKNIELLSLVKLLIVLAIWKLVLDTNDPRGTPGTESGKGDP